MSKQGSKTNIEKIQKGSKRTVPSDDIVITREKKRKQKNRWDIKRKVKKSLQEW
jgi:hypothetical protein